MFKPYLILKSRARTLSGINAAIRHATGSDDDFYPAQADLDLAIREGFLVFDGGRIIIYADF